MYNHKQESNVPLRKTHKTPNREGGGGSTLLVSLTLRYPFFFAKYLKNYWVHFVSLGQVGGGGILQMKSLCSGLKTIAYYFISFKNFHDIAEDTEKKSTKNTTTDINQN